MTEHHVTMQRDGIQDSLKSAPPRGPSGDACDGGQAAVSSLPLKNPASPFSASLIPLPGYGALKP